MALYAFDGTWNENSAQDNSDTNVVKFKELYDGENIKYIEGVGTRFGVLGQTLGGLFGAGGKTRIDEMYEALEGFWAHGDKVIDIVGFSRGAAMAVHFANRIGKEGVAGEAAKVRFLGVWDIVGSFGLSFDTFINFQDINLGWDIDEVDACVAHTFHAMALNERRETFNITRLDPEHVRPSIQEVWFRGVHSDIGGGGDHPKRSNIALNWMLDRARDCELPIDTAKATGAKYSAQDIRAPITQNDDIQRDPPRAQLPGDSLHESVDCALAAGERRVFEVDSKLFYNFSGVELQQGGQYRLLIDAEAKWSDGDIECGPKGWTSDRLDGPKRLIVQLAEGKRRHPDANWFELIAVIGDEDEDDKLFRALDPNPFTATADGPLYLFANDLRRKYGNNDGTISVEIERLS